MLRFLMLKLDGPMQAWGTHTYEDFRPSNGFPTRSGLLGLIGACLGLERRNHHALERLAQSLTFTVRVDRQVTRPGVEKPCPKNPLKQRDFHTVLDARKVDGSVNKNPVVSHREYLYDAVFTVAVEEKPGAAYSLERLAQALRHPVYTPVLGRRSCPLARPLLDRESWIEAADAKTALSQIPPGKGLIYAEGEVLANTQRLPIRDLPMHSHHRMFSVRQVYVHAPERED
jgi:CRISPR system Cascade subunit CasD